ncbi:protein SCAR2 isoform X2 [Humulus lupulus]|uniref:protein SCAR2 isoform X2 n=1 Tax=Humulus lupulus TaxID=3486 RepID=UPI002B40DB3B|nr:protein SCAR2 isoform X2 [Humulus lupulus]
MPLTRYRVRSEYGLADPELYKAADKDDPEALLEGVAMAGLVGVLRQLGDLAEFAAEIFHDLHEEVMATSARGHGLMVRVQQLEAEFPPIEKALLSQTTHSSFFCNSGVDWHPNLRSEQNLVARGDLPRFVMDSYEESRGPPRLFLLDKFDVAGAGACLKRYTDPSFFKVDVASGMTTGEAHREKKNRKVKKKGMRWRNGETTPEVAPTSHAKLHQLFLEERIENGHSDSARLVKLKRKQINGSAVDSKTGKSYMERFVETPPERELACETSFTPALVTSSGYTSEPGIRILEISTVSPAERSPRNRSASSSPNVHEVALSQSVNGYDKEVVGREIVKVPDTTFNDETAKRFSPLRAVQVEKASVREGKNKRGVNGYESDDMTSEVDNYMDALASMESELETDNEYRHSRNLRFLTAAMHAADSDANEEHLECVAHLSDTQSLGNFSTSDDGNNSFKKNRSSFSYSDTPSSVVENIPSDFDGDAKVSPPEICGTEIVDKSTNKFSVIAEPIGAKDDEFVVSRDICIEKEGIPDHGNASNGVLLNNLYPSPLQLDPGASSLTTDLSDGPQIVETSPECINPNSEVPDTVENGTTMVESLPVDFQDSSQENDDMTETSERYIVNELEDNPNVISDDALHLSNISELDSGKESRGNSLNDVSQALVEVEDSNKSLVSGEIESPSNSITEKQLCFSSLPVSETDSAMSVLPNNFTLSSDHSDVSEAGNVVLKVGDAVTANGANLEDLPPTMDTEKSHIKEIPSTVDSPQTLGLKELQFSISSDNVSYCEVISAEAEVSHSKEKPDVEEISGTEAFEPIGQPRSSGDAVGTNVVSLEYPSGYLSDAGGDDLANSDTVVHETVEVENAAVDSADSANIVDNRCNGICLPPCTECFSSRSPTNLQQYLEFVVPQQEEGAFDVGVSPEDATESAALEKLHPMKAASSGSGLNPSIPDSYGHFSSKIAAADDDVSSAEKAQYSVSASDITAVSPSFNPNDQESEFRPCDGHHVDSGEDTVSLPTCPLPEAKISSEKSAKLQADQAGMDDLLRYEAGIHPETLLEKFLKLQADQDRAECVETEDADSHPDIPSENLHVECLQVDRASINASSLPSEQIISPKHFSQETWVDASVESSLEDLPSQSSTSEFSLKSAGPEVDVIKQASSSSEFAPSSVTLLPEVTQVDLGEMPPLPPLPPMQWRMGKFGQGLFPSMHPFGGNENAQVNFPVFQGGMQPPQHPFFPLTIEENEKSLHVAEPLVGNLVQPPTYSMQLPRIVNDANSQYNPFTFGGTQSLNPFLTLPEVSSERYEHSNLAVERDTMHSGSNFLSPTVPTESTSRQNHADSQDVSQLMNEVGPPETGVDTMENKQLLKNSEEEQGNSLPPPTMVDEQARLSLLMPEGEKTWLSTNSTMMPDSEVERPNGHLVNKLPRPRNPLIDEVNAHGKSKLRKVAERVRPQNGPKTDERDSLLEQIRAKSFNLKPATSTTRPSMPGPTPKTNLRVAAILEKANAIRQALAGSDDEDDDNWSDS